MSTVIVIGGGLAGMTAASTVLENGGKVVILDKSAFCGGNSIKATSGINGAGTKLQKKNGIPDTVKNFTGVAFQLVLSHTSKILSRLNADSRGKMCPEKGSTCIP